MLSVSVLDSAPSKTGDKAEAMCAGDVAADEERSAVGDASISIGPAAGLELEDVDICLLLASSSAA